MSIGRYIQELEIENIDEKAEEILDRLDGLVYSYSFHETKEEIAEHYTALGAQRKREGFKASEVIQALIIIRRHLWLKILAEGFIDNVLELNQALALNNRVILFFDRAIHYTIKGYEEAE